MALPNVLLVILDSVRAKNTSLHGHPRETTPALESFADESTVYDQARAPSIHSIASHVSIFSGYHVEEHNVIEHESQHDPATSIWTELAEEFDYSTGLFTPNAVITMASNLDDQFDTTVGPSRYRRFQSGLDPMEIDGDVTPRRYLQESLNHPRPVRSILNGLEHRFTPGKSHDPERESGETYIDHFREWRERQSGQWAACLNLMDAHYPFRALPEFHMQDDDELRAVHDRFQDIPAHHLLTNGDWWALEALEYLYDECIRQADAAVEELFRSLAQAGALEDTLVVVTSDHGEAFGEYSQVSPGIRLSDHSWGIHECQTHVPLLVKEPGQTAGERVGEVASLVEFPNVVRSVLRGGSDTSFVPEDETVLASTYRVPEPGDILPETVDKDDYIGAWRAVYQNDGDSVLKYTTHSDDEATVEILDAQRSIVRDQNAHGVVSQAFDELSDVGASLGMGETTEDVEERLESLGYLR